MVAVISSVGLALSHSPVAPLPGVITIFLLPGAGLMSFLRTRPSSSAGRLVLAVCLSMTTIMVVGGVASLIGPHLGLAHPLDPMPESVIWFLVALLMLVGGAVRNNDPVTWIFDGVRTANIFGALAAGVLLVVSILGVAQLNYSGDAHLAVFSTILDVVVLLAGVVGGWSKTSRWPLNTLLYAGSLALLLSTSLRGAHLYGWDVQQEFGVAWNTIHAGVWTIPPNHDPYASMLSLTVLPAVLHSLVKLRLLAFFQLVVPAILALIPLAVFSTIRSVPRWITSGRSAPRPGLAFAVVVGLIISSVAYSSELVSITRQAMALTMLTAVVMVLFDRTMIKRPAQVIVWILIISISFTHYTTSYLVAVILLCAWPIGWLWSRGLVGIPKVRIERHRYDVQSRKMINGALVVVAVAAAFGWNLVVTRNDALSAPTSAITSIGTGFSTSTNAVNIPPRQFESILVKELSKADSWIARIPGSGSIRLAPASAPVSPGVVRSLQGAWTETTYLLVEALWIFLGISLLYGIFRLGRRRSYEYSADLVGLAVAGLFIGGILRFSGTLANYYNPERAAIFTAILLAAPVTLFLDDVVSSFRTVEILRDRRLARALSSAGFVILAIFIAAATGLGSLFFGGQTPGSLSARNWNTEDFTASTPEFATAVWLRNNLASSDIVQSDLFGHLVLLSEPGNYHLVTEIVPPEVDNGSYIYLSTVNLKYGLSQAEAENGAIQSAYRSNLKFFNKHFNVVYSTGATRVYH